MRGTKLYRLVIERNSRVEAVELQFEADGPHTVLFAADRLGPGREVAVFEDGLPLARLGTMEGAGYWVINPPQLGPRIV